MAARKKRVSKKVDQEGQLIEGPEYRGESLYFSPKDLSVYELASTRYQNATVRMENLMFRIDREKREATDRLNSLRNDQIALAREIDSLKKEVVAIEQEIVEKYNVDLTKLSYHPKTGKIEIVQSTTDGGEK